MNHQKQEKKKLSFKEQKEFEELDKEIPALEEEALKFGSVEGAYNYDL